MIIETYPMPNMTVVPRPEAAVLCRGEERAKEEGD
jgi:hypothetical protein